MTADPYDRTIHAVSPDRGQVIVRYDRAGRYALEDATTGEPIKPGIKGLGGAVDLAVAWHRDGGTLRLDRPGGQAFDARARRALGLGRGQNPS